MERTGDQVLTDGEVLKGMRVIEVSAFVAAPSGGMTLAQMGADVIRIDAPWGGLDYRRWPVIEADNASENVSLFWAGLNKHKKSVAIDITKPEGRELAQQLIVAPEDDAGILLTNMPAKGWLEYDVLKKKRRDLIQLTIQGDRHGGSAVDYTLNPRLGLPYLTGPTDYSGVVNHVLPAWDLVTGQMAALGVLAAERYRAKHGIGQHVKLPLEDVALAIMANLGFIAEAERGNNRPRSGNDLFGAFGRDFETADDQRVMVVGLTSKQWRNLVATFELVSAMDNLASKLGRDFSLEGDRFKAKDEISELFAVEIKSMAYQEVAQRLDANGVCWGKYQTVEEMVKNDPACSTENPLFARVEQPGIGETLTPCTPFNFGVGRVESRPAPRLGQHTEEILLSVLGISTAQLGIYIDKGIAAIA